jgi:4a-hydroxytetrahydrobiopterin dehydratase
MAKQAPLVQLAEKRCVPCQSGAEPLKGKALQELYGKLGNGWELMEQTRLEKEFRFNDFRQALDFVNRVGELAESEGHHPDLLLSWGKVKVILWTHKVKGLHENDFILAAKIDQL